MGDAVINPFYLPAVTETITAGSTANSYSGAAWVQFSPSVTSIMRNIIQVATNNPANQCWLNIGVGPSSSSITIIYQNIQVNNVDNFFLKMPLPVPAGNYIWVQAASSTASTTVSVSIAEGWDPDYPSHIGGTETYYESATSNNGRNIISGSSSWASINGTTGHDLQYVVGWVNCGNAPFQLGIGASGSQHAFFSGPGGLMAGVANLQVPICEKVHLPTGQDLWILDVNTSVILLIGVY